MALLAACAVTEGDDPSRKSDLAALCRYARDVHAEGYDPGDVGPAMPASEPAIIIMTELDEKGGVTTLVTTIGFPSKEARDAALSTGMTDGMEMSYALLDDLFSKAA